SMAGANSQPPTESMVAASQGTPYDTSLDLELLAEIARYFGEVRKRYAVFETGMVEVDASVLIHQIPGGMTSNLISQLKEQNALDRLDEVLAEVPRVRRDMGYPPLVTPTSQLVGTQAVLNVLYGERYKVVPKEVRLYLQGYYGTSPSPVDPELLHKTLGEGVEVITGRPADYLEPEMEKAQAEAGDMALTEEDLLSWALFPQVARDFFQWRREGALPEKEMVAAIAAALSRRLRVAQPAKAAPRTVRSDGPSPWLIAGRHRAMRKAP
ncbi:MAG TPA: pyruvate carboxylase subunit B, partial [Dehalococcoidia bacterium]|nr:pyruvate carboxylase subunit B [Dehalococcoidia bacterium]